MRRLNILFNRGAGICFYWTPYWFNMVLLAKSIFIEAFGQFYKKVRQISILNFLPELTAPASRGTQQTKECSALSWLYLHRRVYTDQGTDKNYINCYDLCTVNVIGVLRALAGKIRGAINVCLDFLLSAFGGPRQKWK